MRLFFISYIFISFSILANQDFLKIHEKLLAGEYTEAEDVASHYEEVEYSFSSDYCLIGIHKNISKIRDCAFSPKAYKEAYEANNIFATQFDNTDNEVEFECVLFDAGTDEYKNCNLVREAFSMIKKSFEFKEVEEDFGEEFRSFGINLNADYVTMKYIEDSDPHHELHVESEGSLNRYSINLKGASPVYTEDDPPESEKEVCLFNEYLEKQYPKETLNTQKDILISFFNTGVERQEIGCSLLLYIEKYPEDFDTMNLIYLAEDIDLNLCKE